MNVKHLTDKSLLTDTKKLASDYRRVTTELLHHLAEIESRKLYADLGYSSLFFYVVGELGFSESSAARRIKAARLLIEIPHIDKKIETGELNLTNLSMAADILKTANTETKKEILSSIENKSTRECERTLLQITGPIKPPVREIKPISQTTNLLSVELTNEEIKLYEELKGLVRSQFWTTVLSTALSEITKKRFKTNAKGPIKETTTRFIPASLKKAIFERDKRCTNCGRKSLLEYDHIIPFSMGGKTELKNLRLLCRTCNQRARLTQNLTATYHRNT